MLNFKKYPHIMTFSSTLFKSDIKTIEEIHFKKLKIIAKNSKKKKCKSKILKISVWYAY